MWADEYLVCWGGLRGRREGEWEEFGEGEGGGWSAGDCEVVGLGD